MAEDKWMVDRSFEATEGSATVMLELELCNDTSDDDGTGNFHAASPLDNVQWTFLSLPAEGQEETSKEDCVEAVREEGYRQVENVPVILPSSTILAGGTGTVTQPSNKLPHSDDSPSCSIPTDFPQVPDGMLEVPYKRMMSYIRSISETDEETSIRRHRALRLYCETMLFAYYRKQLVMYPQMVQGDLTKVCAKLEWRRRCQILYQLSAGLAFLHSSVPAIRDEICHGSIKSENIYLDQNLNARIGNFSKAIELRKKSASPNDVGKYDAMRKEPLDEDIYSFASVGLFLLSSTDATDFLPGLPEANEIVSCEEYWDMEIWKCVSQQTREDIARLIVHCSKKHTAAECLENNLKRLLVSNEIPLYNLPEDHNYCIYCCVNIKDDYPVPVPSSEFCPAACTDACPSRRFCRTCYQTSYRNTLYCPDHGPLKDKICQKDVYAILLSGFEKDELKQNRFDRDIESIFNTFTDPRIMGLSDGNVFKIDLNFPDKLTELHDAVRYLKNKKVHMLIVYYCGHGNKGVDEDDDKDDDEDEEKDDNAEDDDNDEDNDKGDENCDEDDEGDKKDDNDKGDDKDGDEDDEKDDSDEDDDKDDVPFFLIGEEHSGITDKDLRKLLTPFTKTSLLVIMDCCFAARYKVLPEIQDKKPLPEIFHVQFNATGSSNTGLVSMHINSIFTCCLVRAMEGGFRRLLPLCDVSECKCEDGVCFKSSAAAFGIISIDDCDQYITEHMKILEVDSSLVKNGFLGDIPIARYRDTPLGVFKYDIRGVKGILNIYHLQDLPDDLLRQLWDEIDILYGRSSGRHQLLKNLDFCCLMMVVPGIDAEREIQTKREVIHECSRGHVIQIRIRSSSQVLDQD